MVMLFDSREAWSPTPSLLNMYVEDVEKVYRASLKLGATSVTDINQRIEEIEPAEIKRRAATPEAAKGIAYIQKSLDEALRAQQAFFAEAA
jgi:PhnB protein